MERNPAPQDIRVYNEHEFRENLTKRAYGFPKFLSFKQTRVNGPLVLVSMKSFKTEPD